MAEPPLPTLRGRGASLNPTNRFEALELEPDPGEAREGEGRPKTVYYRDSSRSFITTNSSPDIGYNAGINPYRGCEHGCIYCLSGDTLILMADGATKPLEEVRTGDAIYGTTREGRYRRYVKTEVLAHWRVNRPAYRVRLEDGTCLITGGDHRFLTERGWKFVTGAEQGSERRPHLTTNNKLMGTGAFAPPLLKDVEYENGYLCGLIRGDGHLAVYPYEREGRSHGDQYQFRLVLADNEALERGLSYLRNVDIATHHFTFQNASKGRRLLQGIRTHSRDHVLRLRDIIAWPETPSPSWFRGYLAGVFDAEGSYSGGILRISNTDRDIIRHIVHGLETFGFSWVKEPVIRPNARDLDVVRVTGGLREHLRFFHTVDPAVTRKRDIEGRAVKSSARLRVVSIEPLRVSLPLFDITTGTGDFIANGVVSHNCYARPTHEYLGFSAGLDFETRIMVKTDGPELLRRELSSPRWTPQVIGVSGVTDIYQPIERKLELTRRCLEVLAEFRNPVALITKNHLITRDIDLIAELARYDAVSVAISLTTLNEELRRVMEPRTSTAERRLAAVETLAASGVHVGVMTAPIIPGLNDYEIPALVSAAAEAGAKFAAYSIVHLPYGLGDLFTDWLERHFPERKDKVLNRIREMRGGRLNDPRFGYRMSGEGLFAEQIGTLHRTARRRAGLNATRFELSTEHFMRPGGVQGTLFDGPAH